MMIVRSFNLVPVPNKPRKYTLDIHIESAIELDIPSSEIQSIKDEIFCLYKDLCSAIDELILGEA